MHINAKAAAAGGLLLAMTVLFMALGSALETGTLFLLAAASYFVGIMVREFSLRLGLAFYAGAVFLGFILAPNKLYVLTYSAMGLYIWVMEAVWHFLERHPGVKRGRLIAGLASFAVFNVMYLPALFLLPDLLFAGAWSYPLLAAAAVIGQIVLVVYNRAYVYAQAEIWGKLKRKILS